MFYQVLLVVWLLFFLYHLASLTLGLHFCYSGVFLNHNKHEFMYLKLERYGKLMFSYYYISEYVCYEAWVENYNINFLGFINVFDVCKSIHKYDQVRVTRFWPHCWVFFMFFYGFKLIVALSRFRDEFLGFSFECFWTQIWVFSGVDVLASMLSFDRNYIIYMIVLQLYLIILKLILDQLILNFFFWMLGLGFLYC